METISIKLEKSFLKQIEKIMKLCNYSTKTEFIREALRKMVDEFETRQALKWAKKMYGAGAPRITTDEELHKAGEEAVKELEKKFGLN